MSTLMEKGIPIQEYDSIKRDNFWIALLLAENHPKLWIVFWNFSDLYYSFWKFSFMSNLQISTPVTL